MSTTNQIKQAAIEILKAMQQRVAPLKKELAQIEKRKVVLETQINDAKLAAQRVSNFPAKLGADYLCPRCWVLGGQPSPLRPIPSDPRNDKFRCSLCQYELLIPM